MRMAIVMIVSPGRNEEMPAAPSFLGLAWPYAVDDDRHGVIQRSNAVRYACAQYAGRVVSQLEINELWPVMQTEGWKLATAYFEMELQ